MIGYEDIIIGILLLIFGIEGLKKGFIVTLFSLLAWIIGIIGAIYFSDYVAEWLNEQLDLDRDVVAIIGYVVTFIVLVLITIALGKGLKALTKMLALGGLDQIGGVIFGLVKGVVIASLVLLIIARITGEKAKPKSEQTILYEWVQPVVPWALSKFLQSDWKAYYEQSKKSIEGLKDDAEQVINDRI